MLDSSATDSRSTALAPGALVDGATPVADETADVGKATSVTASDGERIAEAIDRALADRTADPDVPRDPVLAQYNETASEHVLRAVAAVAAANLGDALLILSYDRSIALLAFATEWLQQVRWSWLVRLTLAAAEAYARGANRPSRLAPAQLADHRQSGSARRDAAAASGAAQCDCG